MNNLISIVICTYNRCESLKDTLDSLLAQDCNGNFNYEILVIDNNSKDETKEIVKSYISKFNGRLRYLFEANQGLSYARNKGINESRGDFIAFTDDDVIIDKLWLDNIGKLFQQNNCDAIGGRILPLFTVKTPNWIKDNLDLLNGPLTIYDYGENTHKYNNKAMIPFFGANMAFRKELFGSYGLFRTDLGVGQGKIGEETEFFRRLENTNKSLYYCGNALVWHKVDNKRTGFRHIAKWWMASGRFAVAAGYDGIIKDTPFCFGFPRYLIREIAEGSIKLLFLAFNKREFLKIWRKVFWNIGVISEYRRAIKHG